MTSAEDAKRCACGNPTLDGEGVCYDCRKLMAALRAGGKFNTVLAALKRRVDERADG